MAASTIPIEKTDLAPIQSAFVSDDSHGTPIGFGPVSQATECYQRHPTQQGMCWGSFPGQRSRFVNLKDHDISCMQDENRITRIQGGVAAGGGKNIMGQYATSKQEYKGLFDPTSGNHPCLSYGTYSNCPNCISGGYGTNARGNCYAGNTVLDEATGKVKCVSDVRERLRSQYDAKVQASQCDNKNCPMTFNGNDLRIPTAEPPTYAGQYAGDMDPFRRRPYGSPWTLAETKSGATARPWQPYAWPNGGTKYCDL